MNDATPRSMVVRGPVSREMFLEAIQGIAPRTHIANHFAMYCEPPRLARFLMRYELMKRILNVHGSIVECGVRTGVGMMEWYRLSKLLEPLARRRVIYGFDTFAGFPHVSDKDVNCEVGDQTVDPNQFKHVKEVITMQTLASVLVKSDPNAGVFGSDIVPQVTWEEMIPIQGDFMETGEQFLKDYPHVVIAMLFLDFDLYEPTAKALELFVPRMPKGALLVFDELNHHEWPGETLAALPYLRHIQLRRFTWEPTVSYAVL